MGLIEESKKLDFYNMKPGTYYSLYMDLTNKGDNLKSYAPVFKVEVKETRKDGYENEVWMFPDVVEIVKEDRKNITPALLKLLENNRLIVNHAKTCEYFAIREDAEKYHDSLLNNYIPEFRIDLKDYYKEKYYNKPVSKLESNSLKFYEGLTKKEKTYIKWLADNKIF